MAEAVLNGLAEVVKSLTEKVVGRVLEEIEGAWGLKDNLELLRKKRDNILEDAIISEAALNNEKMKRWVQRVKGLAYDADDVMDEYAIEMFRRKMEPENRRIDKICNFFKRSSPLVFHILMAHKVRKILSSVEELKKEGKENYGIDEKVTQEAVAKANSYADNLSEIRNYAAVDASELVGRADDVDKLLEMICGHSNEERSISTFAIIGMGGLGKTALARCIYEDAKTVNHFTKKMWTCVSERFDSTKILNDMIESGKSCKKDLHNQDAIIRTLQKELEGKRFMLVLDDVWNENQELWDLLLLRLRKIGGLPGSVILITTRSMGVAEAASALLKHKLKVLSEEESWSLFKQKVSVNSTPINSLEEKVGRRIVKKCDGIPLAIKLLGSLLMSRRDLREWALIEKSEIWDLPQGQNQILPSLLLSFNHLPSASLKQCFAYLSIFRRNTHMCKSELIGVWSSQDYLSNGTRYRNSVEIGEDNLRELLNSSLLQEYREPWVDTVYYDMHDLVYDLAVYVSGNDLVTRAEDLQEKSDYRHLTLTFGTNNTIFECPPEIVLRKLWTVYWMGKSVPWNMLSEARYLRTLSLKDSSIEEVPADIELLKHLRYLDLSQNPISTLPDSIGKLYQLQTLVLEKCDSMKKLPKALYSLVNLAYIWTDSTMSAPKGLAQLSNLHVLPSLALEADEDAWSIDELGKLYQLRDQISINGLECVKDKEEARKADLSVKAMVLKLTLSWSANRKDNKHVSDDDVLDGLEPHPNITSLRVENFKGEKFPPWIMTMAVLNEQQKCKLTPLCNLTEVILLSYKRCCTLPTLGQLPVLERLILWKFDVDCIGHEFYGGENLQKPADVSFPRLLELEIINFPKLTTWASSSRKAYPRLKTLRFVACPAFCYLPDDLFGASSLIELEILDCLNLRTLPTSLEGCTSLKRLRIHKCPLFKYPTYFSKLQRLSELAICYYPAKHVESMLEAIQRLPSLRNLTLSCDFSDIRSLPQRLELLTQVEVLWIDTFPGLEDIPDWIFCSMTSLKALHLKDRKNLKDLPVKEVWQRLQRLRLLQIWGC